MNSKQKQSISTKGKGLNRKVRIRTYSFSKRLVTVLQPYSVNSISAVNWAYIPCQSRFSLNKKCMCFSNAFEAHSDTVCATTRQGITACSVALLDSFTAGGCSSRGEEDRDRPWAPNMQNHMYLPAPSASPGNTLHGEWKGDKDLKPAPLATARPLLGHTMTLSSGVRSCISTFTSTPLMYGASTVPLSPSAAPTSPWAQGREKTRRSTVHVPTFLFPLQEKCPFFPSNSHPRIIYLKVVRLPN